MSKLRQTASAPFVIAAAAFLFAGGHASRSEETASPLTPGQQSIVQESAVQESAVQESATPAVRGEEPAPLSAPNQESAPVAVQNKEPASASTPSQEPAPVAAHNQEPQAPPTPGQETVPPPAAPLPTANQEATPPPARPQETAPANAPGKAKTADCDRASFRIVVDVGHTADKPGADSSRGVTEYSFNMRLADEIRQKLLNSGFSKTVELITATAPWRGLVERAQRANRMLADLFVSIHHDSVPDYLLENWEYEGQQRPFSDRFKGYAIFISHQNADPKGSLEFGHFLGAQLKARGLHFTPHYTFPLMRSRRHELLDTDAGVYRYDQLVVLEKTLMPAVLLEAGSIINRDEELELAGAERRGRTSDAVAAAVEDFCAARWHERHDRHIARLPLPQPVARIGRANSAAAR